MSVLKKLGLGLLSLVLGLILLGLFFFVEAHIEMRGIEPRLPSRDDLLGFTAGAAGPISVEYVESGVQRSPTGVTSTTGGFLLTWADGRRFALDLGMDFESMSEFGKGLEVAMGADPVTPFGSLARRLGEDVRTIQGIGFSHLHIDHTQGALDLCAERKGEALSAYHTPDQSERENYTTSSGREALVQAGCIESSSLEGAGPLYPVPGFPGLAAFAAGGHTPGSTVFLARVNRRLFIFVGDITNRHADLLQNRPKGFVYSYLMIPEHTERLAELRVWLSELHYPPEVEVVVSHDHDAIENAGIPFR